MVRFPMRLIFFAYGGAALFAGLRIATGAGALEAGLIFWFGGTLLIFALPMLFAGFRGPSHLAEAEAAADRARIARANAVWEADLADDRTPTSPRRAG